MIRRAWFPALVLTMGSPAFSATIAILTANVYVQHNLVSDIPGVADVTDPNLVNPWGISESTTSPFWISDEGTGKSTLYNGSGAITAVVVTIPPAGKNPSVAGTPTGQVQNSSTGFLLANGTKASFIWATEDGTISAWNGGSAATIMVDNSGAGAAYTGLAINAAGPTLYAANFASGKIDVFNSSFSPTTASGGFTDPNIPSGYAPYNIWNLGGKLYVTYAKQGPNGSAASPSAGAVAGAGNGFVDIFDTNGNLLQRAASNGPLNAPWGVAIAPASWGAFGGDLLVGNFGDGWINAFDSQGNALGALQDSTGKPLALQGLWAILFGNGKSGGDPNTLYFTSLIANPNNASDTSPHGLFGAIAPPSQVLSVSNAASAAMGPIAPGEVVVLNGFTVGPSPLASAVIPSSGSVGTFLGATSVYFNGVSAPILYASASATSAVVPYEVAGSATANVQVVYKNQPTANISVPVATSAPGLFTLNESGSGTAVAINSDGTVNGSANPASRGSAILLFATGEGLVDPPAQDGAIAGEFFHEPVLPVTLSIGGQTAQVLYAGSALNDVAGVLEIEAIVPATAGTGAVPVVLIVGTASSQSGVTLNLK